MNDLREIGVSSASLNTSCSLLCFSHLRWDFVFQRPQHLMTRMAAHMDVHFWEEPVSSDDIAVASLRVRGSHTNVVVITPHLPATLSAERADKELRYLLDNYVSTLKNPVIRWYYTPMMLPFSRHVNSVCTIYDCMDELANFKFASPAIAGLEQELFRAADHVFTGGFSLYESKRSQHASVHPFPSSVDRAHFAQAQGNPAEPSDQSYLPRPRFGFFGVVDERMDLELLANIALVRPFWTFIIVGPVVKIDPAMLPDLPNIHFLGGRNYDELPAYAAGWDVALMPFAINDATRFISPTKTPEYLSAGLPIVSTPITDVIRHYGHLEAVKIASGASAFVQACEDALELAATSGTWEVEVSSALADLSWDKVAARMRAMVLAVVEGAAPRKPHYDYVVVGAGFAGAVMAERLAADSGKRVLIVDRRDHVGGNAFDCLDGAGILVHRYGPHIFHTNSQDIVDYLSHFTDWRPYEHKVLARVDDKLVPMPINRTTLNSLYNLSLSTDLQVDEFLAARVETVGTVRTSEDVVVCKVGRELYEKFFRGYTRKQWGLDPSELDKAVTGRIPTRSTDDDRYFTDTFQAMPKDGFTAMFARMLDHPNIDILTGADFAEIRERVTFDRLVFTGPIDEYFGYRFGRLPYRSLSFRHETVDTEWFQPVAVVNYPSEEFEYTRITEYKYLTGQQSEKTSISYEIPQAGGDPYYPIPRQENHDLFKRYETLAFAEPNVLFVGRLATYRYYNMDQVVGQALTTYRRHKADLLQADDRAQELIAAE